MTSRSTLTRPVLGVDGARGGWVVAEFDETIRECTVYFVDRISLVAERLRLGEVSVAVVDMPIGLSCDGDRSVDTLARTRLGSRRSTFFPTPIREVLTQPTWQAANARSRDRTGKGLSKQAWNLVPKIAELDETWTTDLSDTLVEGHPELSFVAMAGAPLLTKKASPEGRAERLELLSTHLSPEAREIIDSAPRVWRVDAVDALALAWTAHRVSTGTATWLGGELDPSGRPMQLVI